MEKKKLNLKIIIPIVIVAVVVIAGAVIGVVVKTSQDNGEETKTQKISIKAGDSELKVMKNNEVFCTKFDTYLNDYDNKKIKAKIIFVGDFNGCYIVDTKDNVYYFDLNGSFYSKSMFENQKFLYIEKGYNFFELTLENVRGGYTTTTIREDIIKGYYIYSSQVRDFINNTTEKF